MVGVEFVCMTGDGALYEMLEPEMAMHHMVSSLMTQPLNVSTAVKSEAKMKVGLRSFYDLTRIFCVTLTFC